MTPPHADHSTVGRGPQLDLLDPGHGLQDLDTAASVRTRMGPTSSAFASLAPLSQVGSGCIYLPEPRSHAYTPASREARKRITCAIFASHIHCEGENSLTEEVCSEGLLSHKERLIKNIRNEENKEDQDQNPGESHYLRKKR